MISLTLEYALRAVVAIARHGGEPCTSRQIAKITEIPLPYLSKMMQGLVRRGLVHSQRGIHGGFVLAAAADTLTIWDVAEVVDPVRRITHCPLKLRSHGTNLCPLHRRIDDALASTESVFRTTTVSDLLREAGTDGALCNDADGSPVKPRNRRAVKRQGSAQV